MSLAPAAYASQSPDGARLLLTGVARELADNADESQQRRLHHRRRDLTDLMEGLAERLWNRRDKSAVYVVKRCSSWIFRARCCCGLKRCRPVSSRPGTRRSRRARERASRSGDQHVRVAVIGAGIAGLAATRILSQSGHDVTTYDSRLDLGGVWSVTRRYPGLGTQNTRRTYSYSDHPMPAEWPDHPSGAQMQSYLESYADRFEIRDRFGSGRPSRWLSRGQRRRRRAAGR